MRLRTLALALTAALCLAGTAHAQGAQEEVGRAWTDLQAALERKDLAGFTERCTRRYRQTAGDNAYTFFALARARRFKWSPAALRGTANRATALTQASSNEQTWRVAILFERGAEGRWLMDGLTDDAAVAQAYVEKAEPLVEQQHAPPGSPRAREQELDFAFRALRTALFWRDKEEFMALVTPAWRKQVKNSAEYFWYQFGKSPIWVKSPRSSVKGLRGAVVFELTYEGKPGTSIGLLFLHGPKGFRADGLTTTEQATMAYLAGVDPKRD